MSWNFISFSLMLKREQLTILLMIRRFKSVRMHIANLSRFALLKTIKISHSSFVGMKISFCML